MQLTGWGGPDLRAAQPSSWPINGTVSSCGPGLEGLQLMRISLGRKRFVSRGRRFRMRTSILRLLALMSCSRAAGVVPTTAQGVHPTAAESTGTVVGTVTTPDGHPIAGATIGLTFLATDSAQMPTGLPMFTSDAS